MSIFTVTWRIENFSMCPHQVGEGLFSPEFTMPEVNNVKWNLLLCPRGHKSTEGDKGKGDHVSVFVKRSDQDHSSDIETFITSFIIINSDSNLSKKIFNDSFPAKKNSNRGYRTFLSHEKLYMDANGFLPNDVLTFQVRICPKLGENCSPSATPDLEELFSSYSPNTKLTAEECFIRENKTDNISLTHCSFTTRILVERRIFNWTIEGFSAKRKSKDKMSCILESEFHEGVKLQLVCYIEGSEEEKNESLRIDIFRKGMDLRRTFIKCEVSFLYSSDLGEFPIKSEHAFDNTYSRWSVLLYEKIYYLEIENDSLKLKLDFHISYDPQNVKYLTKSESCPQNDLQKEIQKMLEYEDTSDVSFECKNGNKFPVHKFLLLAKSPVFRAMFSSDTLEKQTGVIRMLDTDTTTVQHFRDFFYSDSLPELEFEDMLNLYSVADKYHMEKLKDKCAAFLKNNISADDVYEIITVADMHNDDSLKDYANDFLIAEMDFDSDVWKAFTKESASLAAETMRNCLVKMKKA